VRGGLRWAPREDNAPRRKSRKSFSQAPTGIGLKPRFGGCDFMQERWVNEEGKKRGRQQKGPSKEHAWGDGKAGDRD